MATEKQDTPGVAQGADNAKLKHTEGGATTRDALDNGVPMLQGKPEEPVGPEDALGKGPKRGDYSQVIGDRQYTQSVANPDWDPKNPDKAPRFILEHQNPNVSDVGDAPGKGGVTTAKK